MRILLIGRLTRDDMLQGVANLALSSKTLGRIVQWTIKAIQRAGLTPFFERGIQRNLVEGARLPTPLPPPLLGASPSCHVMSRRLQPIVDHLLFCLKKKKARPSHIYDKGSRLFLAIFCFSLWYP
nr:hypothetical protein [Solanum melongena]WMB96986.1 hypothetical protein [Solanum melongena]WMB97198.1 hypothetical protein [Solanum aethiopicum]